jgi:protein-S-isoprenylcysteine O-methyltransferase Ste14
MNALDDIFIGCWVTFWVYWLAASFNSKAMARSRSGHFIAVRLVIIALVVVLIRSGAVKGPSGSVTNVWLQGVGTTLFFSGLAVAIWARLCLGRNWGMPMTEKADPKLVTNGPYHRIRHPIYAGIILAMIGTMLAVEWYWAFVVALAGAYFTFSALIEERNMARLFPSTYPDYKRRTKMLVPFVF